MGRVDASLRKQIETALLDAFSTREQFRRLARVQLDENLDSIAGGDTLNIVVFQLVDWAERTGRIAALIAGACAENPGNPALKDLADYLTRRPELTGPPAALRHAAGFGSRATLRSIPFIGPIPFDAETADLFFGRSHEIERLASKIQTRGTPLLVLNGLSGCGKTSLLRAGLVPYLNKQGIATIYASILNSPNTDLLMAITRSARNVDLSQERVGVDAIERWIQAASLDLLVLIIDQLERCFTPSTDVEENAEFWRNIARLVRGDTSCPVKLVLAVRSDWLYAFQTVSPTPLDVAVFSYLELVEPLSAAQARSALIGPLEQFQVSYEDQLIDRIVDDLRSDQGFVHPPQLQVVGSALYEYLVNHTPQAQPLRLTLADYNALHGASAILRQHLIRILRSLGPQEGVGWQILLRLVGDNDIRISRHEEDLRASLDAPVFKPVVESLVKYALVIRDISTADGRQIYTLTHDYLVTEIKQHFASDHRLQALRTSQHYLETGLQDNRQAHSQGKEFLPLEHERYNRIWQNHEDLGALNQEALRFLSLSGLWHGESSFAEWLTKLPPSCRQDVASDIGVIVQQQVDKGNLRPAAAIKGVLQSGSAGEVESPIMTALLTAFEEQTSGSIPPASRAPASDAARTRRRILASTLWPARGRLNTRQLAGILPILAQHWFHVNRNTILSTAAGVAVFAAIFAASWFVNERLKAHWVPTTPLYGGFVSAVVPDPRSSTDYFATTDRGRNIGQTVSVYGGSLVGEPWQLLGTGLAAEPVQAATATTVDGDTYLLVAIRGRGMYRWRSGDAEWQTINRGLNSYDIADLAVDPEDPSVLFAATANASGVFESHDGGDSWFDASGDTLFGVSTTEFAFSQLDGGRVIVGTADGRIFYRNHGTAEWIPAAAFPGSGAITALAWEATGRDTLLAGTATGKVFLSLDGGVSWIFLAQLPNVYHIASIAITPGSPERAFLVAYGVGGFTVWRTIDEAYTWEPVADTQFSREHMELIIQESSPGQLIAYGNSGMFVSDDEGASWRWVSELAAPLAPIRKVVASPVTGGPLYALLDGSVFAALDPHNGQWIRGVGLPAMAVRTVKPDPQQARTAYAGIYTPNRWSVYRTEDGGVTWAALPKPTAIPEKLVDDTTAIAVAASDRALLIYLGTASCGVLHSEDAGQTWETFGRTDCDVTGAPYSVSAIAVDPNAPEHVFVAADNTLVYRSDNWGRSWQTAQLPLTSRIADIAVDPNIPGRVYIIAGTDGLWRSDDAGRAWRQVTRGLEGRSLVSLEVGPEPGTLYVASYNGDVWFSDDGGDHWQSVRYNLAGKSATDIALLSDTGELVLSTAGEGIYILQRGSLLEASNP